MTQKKDHIAQLLDMAPKTPPSPMLHEQILATALLDAAPAVPNSPNLSARILASAQEHTNNANVVEFAIKPSRNWFHPNALAGGLMAASLMLGIWTGSSGLVDNLIAAPFELAGLQLAETGDDFNLYNVLDGLTPPENL